MKRIIILLTFIFCVQTASAFEYSEEIHTRAPEESGVPQWIVATVERGDTVQSVCHRLRHVIVGVYGGTHAAATQGCLRGVLSQNRERFANMRSLNRINVGEEVLLPDPTIVMNEVAAQMRARKALFGLAENPLAHVTATIANTKAIAEVQEDLADRPSRSEVTTEVTAAIEDADFVTDEQLQASLGDTDFVTQEELQVSLAAIPSDGGLMFSSLTCTVNE
ncbi:MAG: hypothetical protein ACI9H6_000100 [Patiriisocius sp.]|jgi:hypothetical protein